MQNPQIELEASSSEPEVKFTTFGTREPSEEFFGLLDHFFPDPEAGDRNFFLRYNKRDKKGFLQSLHRCINEARFPLEGDVTIVIEDGALGSESINKIFKAAGWKGRIFVGLFNCYCCTIIRPDHATGFARVEDLLLNPVLKREASPLRNSTTFLDGDLINRFFGQPPNATAGKMPDSSYAPCFREKLCNAFGALTVPTLVIELADSQSLKSLFTAVLAGSVGLCCWSKLS